MAFKLIESAEKAWRHIRGIDKIEQPLKGIPFKDGTPVIRYHAGSATAGRLIMLPIARRPDLTIALALSGAIVTIDAMDAQRGIAQMIEAAGADYVLVVKDNQPTLADSLRNGLLRFRLAD